MADLIRSKSQMYRMLSRGDFGNTIPQYFSVEQWEASGDNVRYPLWGVRSAKAAAHPACRLNCPVGEVAHYARQNFADGVNISMMVSAVSQVTAMLHVVELNGQGLVVDGIEWPSLSDWRRGMASPERKQWHGVAARHVLARHLNENSLADLFEVLATWPGAVVELSALDRCIGVLSHRNAVVWEVRHY
jgi:hypothetical protein